MYKLTFMDYNLPPIVDGPVVFYVDDLNAFYSVWDTLNDDADQKERFRRSMSGENVTDLMTNDPEYNIVQDADLDIIDMEQVINKDVWYTVENGWGYPKQIHVREAVFDVRLVKGVNGYQHLVKWKLFGVCTKNEFGVSERRNGIYTKLHTYGNPVIVTKVSGDDVPDFSNDLRDFNGVKMESIVWRPLEYPDSETGFMTPWFTDVDRKSDLSVGLISHLLADIPGEAG